jgi:hypothetical protein
MKKLTLQQKADKEGVTRQAIWLKTPKGKAYRKAYQKAYYQTDKYKAYRKDYQNTDKYKAYRKDYNNTYYLKVIKPKQLAKQNADTKNGL